MPDRELSEAELAARLQAKQQARTQRAIETCRKERVVPLGIVGVAADGSYVFAATTLFFPEEAVPPGLRFPPEPPDLGGREASQAIRQEHERP
jgi:hypothetical protein